MFHCDIYKFFKDCLPACAENMTEYFPSGKNTIRVRQANGQEFIFSCNGPKARKFETIDQFIADMKGDKNHG